jgi:hypothetical protein
MIRDVRRSFEYYFGNPAELPRQMLAWWGRQDGEWWPWRSPPRS